ncbi:MAG: GTP-binding protein [Candidatus Thorarchaeota archaeon]|nr:GTP-binding protein [Candidatus Thorarchaeota archaeon]
MTSHRDILKILENGENRRTEFKRRLTKADLKKDRREKLVTRIKYMTCENPFEGRFLIGIDDIAGEEWEVLGISAPALKIAEGVLAELCEEASVEIVEEEQVETPKGLVGIYLLKKLATPEIKETCSVNVAGRVNSGKSSLIGALVTGKPDDGKGSARSFLLTHPQEITRGQTADIHLSFLGFDEEGNAIHPSNPLNKEESARILDQSKRIVTFFDAPGHREYSKTMIRSILGADAQYGLVLVPGPEEASLIKQEESNTGIPRLDEITREHLILMSSQQAPFFVVVSKIDKTRPEDLELVYNVLRISLKDIGKIPVTIRSADEIPPIVKEIEHGVIVPVMPVSALEPFSIELLTNLLKSVPSNAKHAILTDPAYAYIDKVYRGIKGTNVVVTGTVKSGIFKRGQIVKVGPEKNNQFQEGRLFSIEMFKTRISSARAGDLFGFDIKDVDKHVIRRGQMIVDPEEQVKSCWEFEANIVVTRHPTRISVGYTPVFQCHTIQQAVVLDKIYDAEYLCVGDFARVRLRFMIAPEAIRVDDKIVLREENTRAIGTIIEIVN